MALIDKETLLSDEQAVTADAFSTNSYDTGNVSPARNIGRAQCPLRAVVTVDEAFNNLTNLNVEIGSADDTAGTNFEVMAEATIALADLTLGATIFDIPLGDNNRRHILARYDVTGTAPTTGKVSCALQIGSDHRRAYPSGHNASQF